MADENWYYAAGGQQQGPVSLEAMRGLLADGRLRSEDLVWREGMPAWVVAGEVSALATTAQRRANPAEPATAVSPAQPAAPDGPAWHYLQDGQQHGPVSAETLRQLLADGHVDRSTSVQRVGISSWVAAGGVPELAASDGFAPHDAQALPAGEPPAAYGAGGQSLQYFQPSGPNAVPALFAGFWLRAVAYVIDSFILAFSGCTIQSTLGVGLDFALPTAGGAGAPAAPSPLDIGLTLVALAVGIAINWLYYALLESSPKQATIGKLALGLRVTDLRGDPLTFGRASGRYFGMFLSLLTCGFGFVMAGFTERKQALHDLIAGTLVVRNTRA